MNRLQALLARGRRRPMAVVYDEAYRLPLSSADSGAFETRRADDALSYALHHRAFSQRRVLAPAPATYEALSRVHSAAYLESLHDPVTLARIFAVDASDVYVDELLRTVRLACGGTLLAARHTLATKHPVVNLLGGFHHAAPDHGGGFCALNDIAVAIAALRAEGFEGRVAVVDFDCHPPDGTTACLGTDASVWLGSVSGVSWGPLSGVDEVTVPVGSVDEPYLDAVRLVLSRVPEVAMVFVLAGGDVLAGDRLGTLALSLNGVRQRDLMVAERFGSLPQVWLPAGGYSPHAWKVLAGTVMALAFRSTSPISVDADPLGARMSRIARSLKHESLGSEPMLTDADVLESLGGRRAGPMRLLEFYSAEGLEYALERYRVLPLLRRLGFDQLHVVIDRAGAADRARLLGRDDTTGAAVTLVELEVERRRVGEGMFLFVNWLTMRNPRAHFSDNRPKLPGQETPGLGLAREMTHMLGLMAQRLVLDGVAFRPSWFHMAYAARHTARFLDPARQGRFEALVRDLRSLPLLVATRAVAEGRVRLNGEPYAWEAEEMVTWREPRADPADVAAVARERERCHFSLTSLPDPPGARS